MEPFIKSHQYNLIKQQVSIIQHSFRTVHDPKVSEAVRYGAQYKIIDAFSDLTDNQLQLLQEISTHGQIEGLQQYLQSLKAYVIEFPQVTEKQVKKLFPKNKKLKLPNLSEIDFSPLTYLSWLEVSSSKLFMVYHRDNQFFGIEGKYTPVNKKDVCALCKGVGEVALVTAISKVRPANSSPDYYKAVGHYMCTDSQVCNSKITDVASLERFIQNVLGK